MKQGAEVSHRCKFCERYFHGPERLWDCYKGEISIMLSLFRLLTLHWQLLRLAGDNAPSNQLMTACLTKQNLTWVGEALHMHCVTHILNLVEQVCPHCMCIPGFSEILSGFITPFKAPSHQKKRPAGLAQLMMWHHHMTMNPKTQRL